MREIQKGRDSRKGGRTLASREEEALRHRLEMRVADLVCLCVSVLLTQRPQLCVVHRTVLVTPCSRLAYAALTATSG